MTAKIRSAPHGGARITIGPDEAQLLRSMADFLLRVVEEPEQQDELAALVGISSSATQPEDPALARLFPDAYTDDAEAAADFRRYTESDLRRHKRENARRVASAIPEWGGEIVLDAEDVQAWLQTLTDDRRDVGVRLRPPAPPREAPSADPGGGPPAAGPRDPRGGRPGCAPRRGRGRLGPNPHRCAAVPGGPARHRDRGGRRRASRCGRPRRVARR